MFPDWRGWARGGAATAALFALVLLGRDAEEARAARLAEGEVRVAQVAAAYLAAVAPLDRPGRSGADARLLSATTALAAADFWSGKLQVWLDRTPLLPDDTAGARVPVVVLVDPDGAPRGAVAAWETVPRDLGRSRLVTGLLVAVLAVAVAAATGAWVARGRSRRVFLGLALVGVAGGAASVLNGVRAATLASTDDVLLRTRRAVELLAISRGLGPGVLERITPGLTVTPLRGGEARRSAEVVRDRTGAWVVAEASRGRAWRLLDDEAPARRRALRLRFAALILLALLGTFAAGAFPPGEGYLSAFGIPRTSA